MTAQPTASTEPVRYAVTDGVATITLNRPEAMNSLDVAAKESLREVVLEAAADQDVRCVVLTGTGRAFCVGQDLKEHITILQSSSAEELFATVPEHYNPIVTALATMPKPVIAAVNGVAAGAGASLAFACDIRVAAESAGFNLAFTGVGLSCDTGASWTLQRLVGRGKAVEMLYFPRTIPAAESLEMGLVTKVVADADLQQDAAQSAAHLAAGPTVAFGAVRRAIAHSAGHDLESSLAFEADLMALTGATTDHASAVEAFVAKRAPVFEGR